MGEITQTTLRNNMPVALQNPICLVDAHIINLYAANTDVKGMLAYVIISHLAQPRHLDALNGTRYVQTDDLAKLAALFAHIIDNVCNQSINHFIHLQ